MPRYLGKGQLAECMRSGTKCFASQLVRDGRNPQLLVLPEWADPPHPQEQPFIPSPTDGMPRYPVAPENVDIIPPVLIVRLQGPPVLSGTLLGADVSLSWTPYGPPEGEIVTAYYVYRIDDDGPATFIAALPPDTFTFVDVGTTEGVVHEYFVTGESAAESLSSNILSFVWGTPAPTTGWIVRTSGTSEVLLAVADNGTTMVAVGGTGTILTSTDGGTTWSPQNSNTSTTLRDVIFAAGKWVVVGDGDQVVTSTDTVTWTAQIIGSPSETALFSITYAFGAYYIVGVSGTNGTAFSSSDAVTWASVPNIETVMGANTYGAVVRAMGSRVFVMVRPSGGDALAYAFTTSNASDITLVDTETQVNLNDAALTTAGTYLMAGGGYAAPQLILRSATGLAASWSTYLPPGISPLLAVCPTGTGETLTCSGYGEVYTSADDGVTWVLDVGFAGPPALYDLTMSNGHPVVVGTNGFVATRMPT
jgi:photosystem II stability/assembly factor-like uncharacterized protein